MCIRDSVHIQLHLSGGDIVVDRLPLAQYAGSHEHIFRPRRRRLLEQLPVGAVIEGQLQDTCPVPQIYEDQISKISQLLYPSADHHTAADFGGGEGSAVVGTLESLHCVSHCEHPSQQKLRFCPLQ